MQEADRIGDGLLARGAEHVQSDFELFPGRTAVLNRTRKRSIVRDFNVEIAQGTFAYDPVVMELDVGANVFVRGVPVSEGTVVSLLVSSEGILGEVRERPLTMRGAISQQRERGYEIIDGPASSRRSTCSRDRWLAPRCCVQTGPSSSPPSPVSTASTRARC